MKKFVCSVCGYVYEGEAAPEVSPKAVERQMDDGSHQSRSSESIREKMGGRKAWFMI